MGIRDGLDALEKRKITCPPPGIARSLVTVSTELLKCINHKFSHHVIPSVHMTLHSLKSKYYFFIQTSNFFFLPVHCNLFKDIQQSCLTVTINGMQEIHPVIYLVF